MLTLEGFGDGTREEIVSFAYTRLDQTLQDAYGDGGYDSYESLPPDRRAAITHAVEQERSRIDFDKTQTEQTQRHEGQKWLRLRVSVPPWPVKAYEAFQGRLRLPGVRCAIAQVDGAAQRVRGVELAGRGARCRGSGRRGRQQPVRAAGRRGIRRSA